MRTSPILGEKAWFGPRKFGWGLSPRSAEGWISSLLAIGATVFATRKWPERPATRFLPGIGLMLLVLFKGTSPGGPRARRKLAHLKK
ncbi:MAG: hypothetical protein EPN30_09130 [Actinomycetota bacterium]|nr:MAG: hypothetical protein EPN30_09130 [Actinomycetota bacterium]